MASDLRARIIARVYDRLDKPNENATTLAFDCARLALESLPCRCSSGNDLYAGSTKCDRCQRLASLKGESDGK
jgi:hypothetical protein